MADCVYKGLAILVILSQAACHSEELDSFVPVRPLGAEPTVQTVNDIGPNTINATPNKDFVDARGRLWKSHGRVEKKSLDLHLASSPSQADQIARAPQDLAPEELAEKLRPQRLVGDYLYELTVPDVQLAKTILANAHKEILTSSFEPMAKPSAETRHILGPDARLQTGDTSVYTGSATGRMRDANGNTLCTLAMIGRSTALSAAHCFYLDGVWGSTPYVSFGSNNVGGTITTPFGTINFNNVQIPTEWLTTGGSVGGQGNPVNHSGWDWDFAIVEFGPTSFPGDSTGWYATSTGYSGSGYNQYTMGYPVDKSVGSQWGAYGGEFAGASGARQIHYIDIWNGQSGACIRTYVNGAWYCTAIQSTHWRDSSSGWRYSAAEPEWNEGRDWDATTYNFFHSYAYSWP